MMFVREHHKQAMDLAELAFIAKLQGETERSLRLTREALNLESQAAWAVALGTESEPTRSILFRSAASLAIDCDELIEAERLIASGLAGYPPPEIAEELRELLDKLYFKRHLRLKGMLLEANELQMTLAGREVGEFIRADEFITRAQYLQGLVTRTAERKLHRTYRKQGPTSSEVKQMQVFIGAAEAASFAVTLRVSEPQQLVIKSVSPGVSGVIGEILDCLEFVSQGAGDALHERIPDPAYYRDFVSKAVNMAPDGQDINLVVLTMQQNGHARQVALTTPRDDIQLLVQTVDRDCTEEYRTVRGFLKYADAIGKQDQIRVIENDGTHHTVLVQEGLDDIVTSLWNEVVEVSGTYDGRAIKMEDIRKVQ